MGPNELDVTSRCLVPESQTCSAAIVAREAGHVAGGALLTTLVTVYDSEIVLQRQQQDGRVVATGQTIAVLTGSLRSILAMERVALNLMSHLSGVATLTARYVAAARGGGAKAKIYDTRKTLPGLRALEKYAVACGGGHNHRWGLHDAVLIKDNHIAHLSIDRLAESLQAACRDARLLSPPPRFVEMEVDTLEQLERVLPVAAGRIDRVLLDNMSRDQLIGAVAMRDRLAPSVELEASGGINLQTVGGVASTGVDCIAVGQITHSVPALDLALDVL